MTYRELLAKESEKLKNAGVTEYETDAWYLFSEAFSMTRADWFLRRDEEITGYGGESGNLCQRFARQIELRSQRVPLQQITGHQEFMGLDFLVNGHVLIPRQDTEILVETVLDELGAETSEKNDRRMLTEVNGMKTSRRRLRILDLCSGSGCIGISLERLSPVPVEVLAADISPEAVRLAGINSRRLGCEHYAVRGSDLFEQIDGRFDVIVSNPPYIPTAVIDTLEDEVRLHEPHLALDGEEDGLAFYRRIASAAPEYLRDQGKIYLEIGYDQGEAVSKILSEGGFSHIRVIRDLAGLDRVVRADYPERTLRRGEAGAGKMACSLQNRADDTGPGELREPEAKKED